MNYKGLSKEQSQVLTQFRAQLNAQFRYTKTLGFYNDSAQLRFTNRVMAGVNLSSIADQRVQKDVSTAYLNHYVANQQLSLNASMKFAYLAMLNSEHSEAYKRSQASASARISASANLSASQKTVAQNAFASLSASIMASIHLNQATSTKSWVNSKSRLSFNANFKAVARHSASLTSSAFSNIQNSFSSTSNSTSSVAVNMLASIAASFSVNIVSSNIASAASSASTASVKEYAGSDDRQISSLYQKDLNNFKISGTPLKDFENVLQSEGVDAETAKSLSKSLTEDFLNELGYRANVRDVEFVQLAGDTVDREVEFTGSPPVNTEKGQPDSPSSDVDVEKPQTTEVPTTPAPEPEEEAEEPTVGADKPYDDTVSLSDLRTSTTSNLGAWVIEWQPTLRVGIMKIPFARFLEANPNANPGVNVLALGRDKEDILDVDTGYQNLFLPCSSSHFVTIENFSISRRNIQNLQYTHGSKYYQVFTEQFPEFQMSLKVVKFGGISERVIKFFDLIMTYVSNPRKYPGGLYMYDIFKENIEPLSNMLNRQGYYKRYKLLPANISKTVRSDDNMMVMFTITGSIVEWEGYE